MTHQSQARLAVSTVVSIALLMLGCFSWLALNDLHKTKGYKFEAALTPAQIDYMTLSIAAASFNASQTNWTVVVVLRTNR